MSPFLYFYENLVDEGVILVDDVQDKTQWDGAYQAYMEFCNANRIIPHVIGNKGGLIYKSRRNYLKVA